MAAICLSRAVVLLGRFPALAGADLAVEPGEIVHLAGANGAGKTTLLRTCAGLHALAGGAGTVLGADLGHVASRRAVRRRVGLLGHETFLYDDLTVEENVRFALRATRSPAAAADVDGALARLGLDGRLRRVEVAHLSAGQRRRVALAAIAARRPDVWLLDEPHAGLDAAGRDLLDELVVDAARTHRAAVVLASHELDRAAALAHRRLVVAGGEVRDPSREPAGGGA